MTPIRLRWAAALVLLLTSACGSSGSSAPRLAPDLNLPDVNGRPASLSDHKGKVVLLDFWSTTCETCLHELPMLNEVQERLAPKGFTVLAVCVDALTPDAVRAFAKEHGMSYPVLASGGRTLPGYSLYGLPQAFLVGRDGFIKKQYMGPKLRDEVVADAEKALKSAH
ncbi:MAG: TlpA disulfide reductase family protein [Elusimicrobiota bacterium]|jgi:cytochrome c biogenesis protein CcmG/thiol:disulfide interchange protein DsbE